jgi:8-oxo-dGTP pyrophosphatase MutT (NUDIX family)
MSPYTAAIRERIGRDLLLLPSVAVLPVDPVGRILLVKEKDFGRWATIGGAIEPDESPEDAALREAVEEAGVTVRLDRLLTVLGGPGYRITYPNGDQTAYVSIVFQATVVDGTAVPDGDETTEVGWFLPRQVSEVDLNGLNRRLLDVAIPMLAGDDLLPKE